MIGLSSIRADRRAATAIEYSLLAALIALAIIGSLTFVTTETIDMWGYVSTTLDTAIS